MLLDHCREPQVGILPRGPKQGGTGGTEEHRGAQRGIGGHRGAQRGIGGTEEHRGAQGGTEAHRGARGTQGGTGGIGGHRGAQRGTEDTGGHRGAQKGSEGHRGHRGYQRGTGAAAASPRASITSAPAQRHHWLPFVPTLYPTPCGAGSRAQKGGSAAALQTLPGLKGCLEGKRNETLAFPFKAYGN